MGGSSLWYSLPRQPDSGYHASCLVVSQEVSGQYLACQRITALYCSLEGARADYG